METVKLSVATAATLRYTVLYAAHELSSTGKLTYNTCTPEDIVLYLGKALQ